MTRRARLVLIGMLFAGPQLAAQTAPPPTTPAPTARPKAKAGATKAPPLNFTGIWELDEKASKGVNSQMEGAVLRVKQNGDRIWIESLASKSSKITAEEIIVDGRIYEKALGAGKKGTLEAAWGKDRQSLWLQAVVATDENPMAGTQRMIWRLLDGGKTWTRQTRTIQPDGSKDTFLVFRKRDTPPKKTPTLVPSTEAPAPPR